MSVYLDALKGCCCSGFFPASYAGGGGQGLIPVSTSPREARLGLCLCNLLWLTKPNDQETVIEV